MLVIKRDGFYEIRTTDRLFQVERVLGGKRNGWWELREYFGPTCGWSPSDYFRTLRAAKDEVRLRTY